MSLVECVTAAPLYKGSDYLLTLILKLPALSHHLLESFNFSEIGNLCCAGPGTTNFETYLSIKHVIEPTQRL